MIEYRLFDVEMCHNVVCKYEDKEHRAKTFDKHKASIATNEEVSRNTLIL